MYINFLETGINNLKLRAEYENENFKWLTDFDAKIEVFNEEIYKKKALEFEIEKIKKQRDSKKNEKEIIEQEFNKILPWTTWFFQEILLKNA